MVKHKVGRPEGLNYATLSLTVTPAQYAFIRKHVNSSEYHRHLLETLMNLAELYANRRAEYEKRDELIGLPTGELGRFFKSKNDEESRELGSYDWRRVELNAEGEPSPSGWTPEDLG